MIEFSVHLITYNNENHIEETLQSILKQKVNFDYEIVVGDDCSTDRTLAIIKQYEIQYPKLFNVQKNKSQQGILKNFKVTLDRCKGKYIFDISGDDLLKTEDAIQKMYNALSKNDSLGFIDSGFDKYYENSGKTVNFGNKKIIESSKKAYQDAILTGSVAPTGICFNKKHLYDFVDFDTYLNMNITIDDYPILVDLVMNTSFKTINESLHIYRIHNQSYSHTKSFKNHFFLKNQMKNLFSYFTEKYKYDDDLIKKFNKDYYKELLFLCGYFEEKEIGKETYNMIKQKNIKDHIHYWASQNKIFRKLVSLV